MIYICISWQISEKYTVYIVILYINTLFRRIVSKIFSKEYSFGKIWLLADFDLLKNLYGMNSVQY